LAVVRDRPVSPGSGGIRGEPQCRLVVVVAVDDDADDVIAAVLVAVEGVQPDQVRLRVVHAGRDIQVAVVVRDPQLGLLRLLAPEDGKVQGDRERLDLVPGRLINHAVDR
jgi:hypothetical protein